MKKHLASSIHFTSIRFTSLLAAVGIIFCLSLGAPVRAQVPGAILSAGALGGIQSSSQSGFSSGDYYAVRGAFSNLFGELRHADWVNGASSIRENGFLAGADISLFHLMLSAGVGVGSSTYQAPAIESITPPSQSYTSLLYEGQAMYQFDLVAGVITAGVGVNYIGESNSVAPITGWGAVASINVGL